MQSPEEIRGHLAAMSRVDARLVAADAAVVQAQSQMQAAATEQAAARHAWRVAADMLSGALGPGRPIEQRQADQVALVLPKRPQLPEPSPSSAGRIQAEILDALAETARPTAAAEIAAKVTARGVDVTQVEISRQLWQLKERGKIDLIRRGFYAMPGWPHPEAASNAG